MVRSELSAAGDLLESAAEDASDDAGERLTDLAEQLEALATRDQDPDHGRLARIESALDEIQSEASDGVASTIDEALAEIHAYRETLDGV